MVCSDDRTGKYLGGLQAVAHGGCSCKNIAMNYTRLGQSGLNVARLCLGCMSFGAPERGTHPWSLAESEARPFFRQAFEAGINFFDTANVYSDGTSEEIVGKLLKEFASRDQYVLA